MCRLGTALFAALHLAQASWLLHGGFDLLFPRVLKVVAATDDRCAPHGCGCEEEAKRRRSCCCDPSAAPAPVETTRSSALEAARCAGAETAMAHALAQPSACEVPAGPASPAGRRAPALPPTTSPDLLDVRALDKVPL